MHLNTQLAVLLKKLQAHDLEDAERSSISMQLLTLGFVDAANRAFDMFESEGTERMRNFLADIDRGEEVLDSIEPSEDELFVEEGIDVRGEGRTSGVILAHREETRRLLIVFAGNTQQLAIPEPALDDPTTSLLCMRDSSRCFALMGMPRLGRDFTTVLTTMQRLIETLGNPPVYVIGASSGGYAALRYAFELKAQGVLGCSAPTSLNIADDPGATTQKYPQLARLYARSKEMGIDMARYYNDAPVRPRAILAYCPAHDRDKLLTERMGYVPGVELYQTPNDVGHTVFPWFNETGKMTEMMERLYALTPYHASAVPLAVRN